MIPPFRKEIITQNFGANVTNTYANGGLLGHPGVDLYPVFSTIRPKDVFIPVDGYCYSVLNKDNPDLNKYRAVCIIYEDETGLNELILGHLREINIEVGEVIKGELAGQMGNTGEVYAGGRLVSAEEKKTNPDIGAHLHLQKRPLIKDKEIIPSTTVRYLLTSNGYYRDQDGFYYRAKFPDNGYNGCVDPLPDIKQPTPQEQVSILIKVARFLLKLLNK